MSTAIDKPLTAQERKDYERLTEVVQTGSLAWVKAGAALEEIRDRRLYRDEFAGRTFDDYLNRQWDMTRMRASQLITSARAVDNVNNCLQIEYKPRNEAQARPLTQLKDPKTQAEAWERAVKTAPKDDDGKPHVTAKHVASVVKEMKPPVKRKARPKSSKPTQSEAQAYAYEMLAKLVMTFTEVTNAFGRFDETEFSSKADLADAMKKLRLARKLTQEAANLL